MRFPTSRSPVKCFMTILVAAIGVGSSLRSVLDEAPGVSLPNDILASTRAGDQSTAQGAQVNCDDLNWPGGSQGACLQAYTSCVVCYPASPWGQLPRQATGGDGGYASWPGAGCNGRTKYIGECTLIGEQWICDVSGGLEEGECSGFVPYMETQSP